MTNIFFVCLLLAMIATILNAAAIIIGSFVGILLKKVLTDTAKTIVFNASGIISLVIGISMAIKTEHFIAFSISLIIGGLIGTALGIENSVLKLGNTINSKFSKETDSSFALGFLNASILFCVGAMAIVGSFKAGTEKDYTLLFTKSFMDGSMSVFFTAAMGIGVAFSSVLVFLYQGLLTMLSIWLKPFVSNIMLNEISSVGGALIIMIGINLLGLKKINTGDFLPALLVAIVLVLCIEKLGWPL